jgi:two-component system sensor histidine kinase KdpD
VTETRDPAFGAIISPPDPGDGSGRPAAGAATGSGAGGARSGGTEDGSSRPADARAAGPPSVRIGTPGRTTLARYGSGLFIAAVALGVRLVIWPLIGTSAPFLHSFPAIILTAWLVGLGPSIMVTIVTAATSLVLFVAPRWDADVASRSDLVGLIVYVGVGALLGWMTTRFREERTASETARLAAEDATAIARAQAAHNERLVRVRDGFASMLAHELRTPLTVIIGDLALLQRLGGTLPDPTPELVEDMQAEAARLQVLVEDLLVLNRDDAHLELAVEPTSVRRTVDGLLRQRARAELPTDLEVDLPAGLPLVQADAVCLGQVLRNLLSNARKYGAPPVRLSAVTRGDTVRISVVDAGTGIPPGDEERIFELFVRGTMRPLGSPGAGVGLYVCRRLMTAMGGRIWAERPAAVGMAFHLELPTATSDG